MINIKPPKEPVKIAIFGSCTTRDNFNRKFNPNYKDYFEVVCFQNQTSIMSIMSDNIKYNDEDLSPLQGWDRSSIEDEFNKVFLKNLIKEQPSILIVDLFADARFKTIKIGNSYLTVNEWKTTKSDFYKNLPKKNTPFIPSESQLRKAIEDFNTFMKKFLPNTKIILNQARGVRSYTNAYGEEEFFNQKFITRLNKRWDMLDNLFIEIVKPLKIDVMSPHVKGYINHIWTLGYVHYTPNFYHNFLKILISIIFQNQLEFLESSLAKLVPVSLFPKEKLELIEEIRFVYISLDEHNKEIINKWLNYRYKEFLSLLVLYNKNIHHYVKFTNYAFRIGIKKVVTRDIDFAKYLLEPIMDRKLFAYEELSPYANLSYGAVEYHNFLTSINSMEKVHFFNKVYNALIFSFEKGKTTYIKNRSAYFLTLLLAKNGDFYSALKWYKYAIDTPNPAPNIESLFFIVLLHSVNIDSSKVFREVNKIFTKDNVRNKNFWILFYNSVNNSVLKNSIQTILEKCPLTQTTSASLNNQEVENFFLTLNKYLGSVIDLKECNNYKDLEFLYKSKYLSNIGKSQVLSIMSELYAREHKDLISAVLLASESNTLYYDKGTSLFISNLFLKNFSEEIRNILKNHPYKFNSRIVNKYVEEQSRNVFAWRRFVSNGFVSGYFDEEVDFLEFILLHCESLELNRVINSRLAYLYYTGTSGISEDSFHVPNIEKSKELFMNIKDNPIVQKYLNHPRLAIYQDMEQYLDNKEEKYLFFENKNSDQLIIVFSCAGSYNRYTQLKVFYQRNKTNVLFLNNPLYNWYHGREWERIKKTINEVALRNFKKENIITYFGSMGGYAALRVGLTYGFRTIVFNPQIDLNIWIKHRPGISVRLLKEKELFNLQNIETSAYEQTPIYYATSSAMEDVEAFKKFIGKISLCKEGLFIIEKIPENIHEGIFGLIYKTKQQDALLNIASVQKKYMDKNNHKNSIQVNNVDEFWNSIIRAMSLRIIIVISNGVISYMNIKNNFLKKDII